MRFGQIGKDELKDFEESNQNQDDDLFELKTFD